MLGFLGLLFTLFVVWVVLTLFKNRHAIKAVSDLVKQVKTQAQQMADAQAQARDKAERAAELRAQALDAQDMAPCPKCGAYVAVGETCSCSKP